MSENPLNPIIEHLKYAEDMIRLLPLSEEYYRGLVSTVLSLLAQLRTSSDMEIFLQTAMKACCDFYQADWAGILVTDATSGMWTVDAHYDVKNGSMAETDIGEDECFEDFPAWAKALTTGEPIILNNIDSAQDVRYRRFHARNLIGYPFLFRPTGFIAIRNPQRYKDKPELLTIITSVGELVFSKAKTKNTAYSKKRACKMTINILGMPMITVAGKTTSAKDFKAPVSWKAIAYLALDNAPITAATLASKIGCAENTDSASGNMRANIHRIRGRISRKAPADVIISNGHGYILNPYYTICTDAKEMERLWNKAQASNDRSEKTHLLTMAFKLYRGDLCEGIDSNSDCHGSGFDWLQGEREYYRQLYNKAANTLMELLAEERDYSAIWNCVNEARSAIKTGMADWYCWRIFSQMKLSGKMSAQEGYAEAHSYLLAAECEALDKHLKEVLSRFG